MEDFDLSEKIQYFSSERLADKPMFALENIKTFITLDMKLIEDLYCNRITMKQLMIARNKLLGENFK